MKVRIATRKSALAIWQSEHVATLLRALPDVDDVELIPISTRGDEILDRSLQKIGGKGLFIKELEVAIERGDADIAVHSMKDVPADMPDGFDIGAVLPRANPRDALVNNDGRRLDELPENPRIGSSSLRRQAQLRMLRADARIEPLRGNVNTRLDKLDRGDYDAIVLAAAGLERLGMQSRISQAFAPEEMMPASSQGVIGIECRRDDGALMGIVRSLDHAPTRLTTLAERAIAATLAASCQSPVASFGTIDGDALHLSALVALPDGSEAIRESLSGNATDAGTLGRKLAERLVKRGAMDLLARCEAMHE